MADSKMRTILALLAIMVAHVHAALTLGAVKEGLTTIVNPATVWRTFTSGTTISVEILQGYSDPVDIDEIEITNPAVGSAVILPTAGSIFCDADAYDLAGTSTCAGGKTIKFTFEVGAAGDYKLRIVAQDNTKSLALTSVLLVGFVPIVTETGFVRTNWVTTTASMTIGFSRSPSTPAIEPAGSISTPAHVFAAGAALTAATDTNGPLNGATLSLNAFTLVANAAPGLYLLDLLAGVLCYTENTVTVCNAPLAAAVRIQVGFLPVATVRTAAAAVSGWLDGTLDYTLRLKHAADLDFVSVDADVEAGDNVFIDSTGSGFSSGPKAALFDSGNAVGSHNSAAKSVDFALKTTDITPGRYKLSLEAGKVAVTVGGNTVRNAAVADIVTVEVGFVPGAAVRTSSGTVTGWLDGSADYTVRLTPPSGSTAFTSVDGDVDAADDVFVDGAAKDALFGTGGTPGAGTHDTASPVAFVDFPLQTATISPGVYVLALTAGKVSVAVSGGVTLRNAPVSSFVTVNVGFLPTVTLSSDLDNIWVTTTTAMSITFSHTAAIALNTGVSTPAHVFAAGAALTAATAAASGSVAVGPLFGRTISAPSTGFTLAANAEPGLYVLSLQNGVFCTTSGTTLCNAPVSNAVTLKVGYVPVVTPATPVVPTTGDFRLVLAGTATSALVTGTNGMIDGRPDSGNARNSIRATPPSGKTGGFHSTTVLSAGVFVDGSIASSATAVLGASPATGSRESDGSAVTFATQATVAHGAYRLKLAAGKLAVQWTADASNVVFNAEVNDVITVRVGFTPVASLTSASANVDVTSSTAAWLAASAANVLTLTLTGATTLTAGSTAAADSIFAAGTTTSGFSSALIAGLFTGGGGVVSGTISGATGVFTLPTTATPGRYNMNVQAGALKYTGAASLDVFSLVVQDAAVVQIGFVPPVALRMGSTTVTGWLDGTQDYVLRLTPPSGSTAFTSVNGDVEDADDVFVDGAPKDALFGTGATAGAGTHDTANPVAFVDFPFQTATISPGVYVLALTAGKVSVAVSGVTIRNAPVSSFVTVQVGFMPTFSQFHQPPGEASPVEITGTVWVNPAHSVRVRVTVAGQTVAYTGAQLPAEYFDAGSAGGSSSPVSAALGSAAGVAVPAENYIHWSVLTSASPGIYKLSLKAGVMSYGSSPTLFNAPMVDAFIVNVGFVPTFSLLKVSDDSAAEDSANNNMVNGALATKARVTAPGTVGNIDGANSILTPAGWVDGTIAGSMTAVGLSTDGTATTNYVEYALGATIATGAYRLTLSAGQLQATTTAAPNVVVKNALVVNAVGSGTPGTIKVGFAPAITFLDGSTAVDAARWITTSNSFTVNLVKPSGVTTLAAAGAATAATFFSDATGSAFSTGATAAGGPLNAQTGTVVGAGGADEGNIRFTLVSSAATAGKYRIALTAGVAKYTTAAASGSVDIFNLAVSPALTIQVGFTLTTSSFTLTQGGVTVSGWIRPDSVTKIVVARPSISSVVRSYEAATVAVGNTDALTDGSAATSITRFFGATAANRVPTAGTATTGEVEFTSQNPLTPGVYKMNLANGVLEVAVGSVAIRNVELADAVTVQVGFTPRLNVQQSSASVPGGAVGLGPLTTGWLDGAITGGISIIVTPPATPADTVFSNAGTTLASSDAWTSATLASSLGSGSSGTIAADKSAVTFTIPVSVNPGVYVLTLKAGIFKYTDAGVDIFNAPLTSAVTVNVGFTLLAANFAVLQGGSAVTGWITGAVQTSIRVTPLASQSFTAATPAGNTVWSEGTGTTLADVVTATTGTVIAASATFPLKSVLDPATYVLNLDAGKLCNTASLCNAPLPNVVTITVGFDFKAADVIVQQQPSGGSFATVAQTNWLDGSLATQVVINRPTDITAITASTYVEPPNKGRDDIWSSNAATSSAVTTLFVAGTSGTYASTALTFAVSSSPAAGVYQIDIKNGAFCYTVPSKPNVCNAPFAIAATVRVGFVASLALVTGATAGSPTGTEIDTATQWLLETRTDTIMRVRMTFATTTIANAVQSQTVSAFSVVSDSTAGFAAGGTAGFKASATSGSAPNVQVTFLYPLDLNGLDAPSAANFLALKQGVICNSGTADVAQLCNAPTTASSRVEVKIGFVPTLAWNYVSGKAQNGVTDVGTGAVSSSTIHDATGSGEELVLKLTITPPTGVTLATTPNAVADMVTTARTPQSVGGISITVVSPAVGNVYEYTVTFAAAAASGTYTLNAACHNLATQTTGLKAVTTLTTGLCSTASPQTVRIAAVPTFTFTYGARAFGQTGAAITAGSAFALDTTDAPADPRPIHDVGGTTGTEFSMTNVALQIRLAVKASATQQLSQPGTIPATAVRLFNTAGTPADVSVQTFAAVVASTTTFVSKEYLDAAGIASGSPAAVDSNGYLFTLNVRNSMPPGVYTIRVDCSVLTDVQGLAIGTRNCPGTTDATYPRLRVGHRVTPSLVYRSTAYDVDEATAATIASGTAFATSRWHDTTRGDLQVAVVFAKQTTPVDTSLKAAASQAADTVTFTSSRLLPATTAFSLTSTFPQGITMTRQLSGTGNYEVIYTFAASVKPSVFTLTLACDKVVDAEDDPAVSTPSACGQTYTIRIGTVPLAPTVTYVSGLNTLGNAVTADAVVPTTMWHDTSVDGDTDLKVKLTIAVPAEHAIGACCSGTSPEPTRAAIVKTASTATGADITTGITITSTVAADNSKLDFEITFQKRTAGSGGAVPRRYFLNLDCSAIKDDLGNALGKRACINAVSALEVAIGYRVTKALEYAAAGADSGVVAGQPVLQTRWHNAVNSPLNVRVTLTPTDAGINLATTGLAGGSAVSNPVTREQQRTTGGHTALSSLSFLEPGGPYLTGTVSANKYTYPLQFSKNTDYAWSQTYTLKYLCQYVLDANGAQAIQKGCDDSQDTVLIGFKPYWTFTFTNATLCASAADCTIKPVSITSDALDPTSTWISREQTGIVLSFVSDSGPVGARGAGFTAFDTAVSRTFTIDADAAALTLFTGADHGLGGTGDAAAALSTLPAATRALASPFSTLTYTLADISSLAPGRYLFKMREGVLTSATANGAFGKSIATTFILQVGIDFDYRVFRGPTGTEDTLPRWQDPCVTTVGDCDDVMRFTVQAREKTTAPTFAVALDSAERAAVRSRSVDNAAAPAATPVLFYSDYWGTSSRGNLVGPAQLPNSPTTTSATAIEFSLATSRAITRPDTYTFQVKPGVVLAGVTPDGGTPKIARNAATYVGRLLIGFKPVVQMWYVPSSTSVATYDSAPVPQYEITDRWLDPSRPLQIRLLTPTDVPYAQIPSVVTKYDYASAASASDLSGYGGTALVFENLDTNTGADCTVAGEVCKVGVLQGTTGAATVGLFLQDAPVHAIGTPDGTGCTAALCPLDSARYNLRVSAEIRAGEYTVNTMNGQLQLTSTGARNYESSFTVRIGWKPSVVFFHPGFDGVECASTAANCHRGTTDGSPDDFRDTWFSNKLSGLKFRVGIDQTDGVAQLGGASTATLSATAGDIPAGSAVTRQCPNTLANPTLRSRLPIYCLNLAAGYSAAAFAFSATGTYVTDGLDVVLKLRFYTYDVASTGPAGTLAAGQYALDIPDGTFLSGSTDTPARNFALSHKLKIGFTTTLALNDAPTAPGMDISTQWVDKDRTDMSVLLQVFPPNTAPGALVPNVAATTAVAALEATDSEPANLPAWGSTTYGSAAPLAGTFVATVGADYTSNTPVYGPPSVEKESATAVVPRTSRPYLAGTLAPVTALQGSTWRVIYPISLEAVSSDAVPLVIALKLRPGVFCTSADANTDSQVCTAHTVDGAWAPSTAQHLPIRVGFVPRMELQLASDSDCDSAKLHRGQWDPDYRGYRRIPDGTADTAAWGAWSWSGTTSSTDIARPMVSFARRLCIALSHPAMTSNGASGWDALFVTRRVPGLLLPEASQSFEPAPAGMFQRPGGSYGSQSLTFVLPPDAATIAAATKLAGIEAGTYDLSLIQGTISGLGQTVDGVAPRAGFNARARITVRLGPQLTFYTPDGLTPLVTRGSAGFTNLRAVRLKIEGTEDDSFEFKQMVRSVNRTSPGWTLGEGDPATLLMTGLVNAPVQKNVPTEDRYLFIDYLLGITNLPDALYVMDVVLQRGASAAQDKPLDLFDQKLWDVTTTFLQVDRTPPLVTPRVYSPVNPADFVYIGEKYSVPLPGCTSVAGPGVPVDLLLFVDAVSDAATVEIIDISSPDNHNLVLVRGDTAAETMCVGVAGARPNPPCTIANAVFRTSGGACSDLGVRGPVGDAEFIITARDSAGNVNTTQFTIPVRNKAQPVLTVVDKRGKSSVSTMYVGSAKTRGAPGADNINGDIRLSVSALYALPVRGMLSSYLRCESSTNAVPVVVADCTGVMSVSGYTVALGNTSYSWTVTLPAATMAGNSDATRTAQHGMTYRLYVDPFNPADLAGPTRIQTSAGNLDTAPSNDVRVVIDNVAPVWQGSIAGNPPVTTPVFSAVTGVVGGFYSVPVLGAFVDNAAGTPAQGKGSSVDNILITVTGTTSALQNGLTLRAGLQGTAGGVSGTPRSAPPSGDTRWSVLAEDEAGHTATGVYAVRLTTVPPDFRLQFNTLDLRWTEVVGGTAGALAVERSATWRFRDAAGGQLPLNTLKAFLSGAQANAGGLEEVLTQTCPSSAAVATSNGGSTQKGTEVTCVFAAGALEGAVNTWLQTLRYSSTHTDVAAGRRTIRVELYAPVTGSAVPAQIATGQRVVVPVLVNDPPVLSLTPAGNDAVPAVTWDEVVHGETITSGEGGRVLFNTLTPFTPIPSSGSAPANTKLPALALADVDDANMRGATVRILTTSGAAAGAAPAFAACDVTRDRLRLPAGYSSTASVVGLYDVSSCTLTLRPLAQGAVSVPKAEMEAALRAVEYFNTDVHNPLGYGVDLAVTPAAGTRRITLSVEDEGNANKIPGGALLSAPVSLFLTITPVDDVPVMDRAALFGAGGLLEGTLPFANLATVTYGGDPYRTKKFTVVLPPVQDLPTVAAGAARPQVVLRVPFDLGPVKLADAPAGWSRGSYTALDADGVLQTYANGLFAKGAILDLDTQRPVGVSNQVRIFYRNEAAGVQTWTDINGAPAPLPAGDASFSWSYSGATYQGLLTVSVDDDLGQDDVITETDLGQFSFRIVFGSAAAPNPEVERPNSERFYIDIRRQACTLSTAVNFLCRSREADQCSKTPQYDQRLSLRVCIDTADPTVVCKPTDSVYYPGNEYCIFAPVSIPARSNTTAVISGGDADGRRSAMQQKLAALEAENLSEARRIAALAEERAQARGNFQLSVPPAAFADAGSVTVSAQTPPVALREQLAVNPVTGAGADTAVVDTSVAVQMGPAGTRFERPVKICIFAGDTAQGTFKVLSVASQIDPTSPGSPFSAWQPLLDPTNDEATGEVCGFTTHFSVFAPVVRNLPPQPHVPKLFLQGGNCPLNCNGRGICDGPSATCRCFSGFTGLGCSERACPVDLSWGEDQLYTHGPSECSGRGTCERSVGTCQCFDGFEGAACERRSCPNECSGHGMCRLLSELPGVRSRALEPSRSLPYSDWDLHRVQACVCDGGYGGPDCSERVCPFGDDVETNCESNPGSLTVELTLSFGSKFGLNVDPLTGISLDTFGAYAALEGAPIRALGKAMFGAGLTSWQGVPQQYSKNEGIAPSDYDLDGLLPVREEDDAIALVAHGLDGGVYITPTVKGVWRLPSAGQAADVIAALEASLKSLPNHWVQSVSASVQAPRAAAPDTAVYSLTFPFAGMALDPTKPLSCFLNNAGTLGCPAAGCRPKGPQLRSLVTDPPMLPNIVRVNSTAILLQPAPMTAGDENLQGVWAVQTTLVLRRYVSPQDGVRVTYSWEHTALYGVPATGAATATGREADAYTAETPLPPEGVRAYSPLVGPFGLHVDMEPSDGVLDSFLTQGSGSGPWSYTFKWSLPSCTVRVTSPLPVSLEKLECGGRGTCERDTGECSCFEGYQGQACDSKVEVL